MNKENESISILASYVTLRELYANDRYNSQYQVLAEFIKYIICKNRLNAFTNAHLRELMTQEFGFVLPDAVPRTAIKKIDFVESNGTSYKINRIKISENTEFEKFRLENEAEYSEIAKDLFLFAKEKNERINEKDLLRWFVIFLVEHDETSVPFEYSSIISEYILSVEKVVDIQKKLTSIREGSILYLGLNYNINETGSIKHTLTLFLDTEILFNIAGYNGEVYQKLALDFLEQVKSANLKERKICLRYFSDVKKEIDSFFGNAESILCGKLQLSETPAMNAILNGCDSVTDVVDKQADFFSDLKVKYGIIEDEEMDYYSSDKIEYNLEDIPPVDEYDPDQYCESIKFISNINKLRRGRKAQEYTDSGFLLITETRKTLELSRSISEVGCGYALNTSAITNILWFKLGKGFGANTFPENVDIALRAKIILSTFITQNIARTYESTRQDYNSGKLSKEQVAARIITLRKKASLPENINIENIEDSLDFSPEYLRRYEEGIELNKTALRKKEELIDRISSQASREKEEHNRQLFALKGDLAAKEKEVEEKDKELKKQKEELAKLKNKEKAEKEKEQRKKHIRKLVRKNIIRIIIVAIIVAITYLLHRKFSWTWMTIISGAVDIATVFGFAFSFIKKDIKEFNVAKEQTDRDVEE